VSWLAVTWLAVICVVRLAVVPAARPAWLARRR